jgi:hypothetical protein
MPYATPGLLRISPAVRMGAFSTSRSAPWCRAAGGVVFNPVFFGAELDDLAAGHALVDGVFAPLREGHLDTSKRLSYVWPELWFAGPA